MSGNLYMGVDLGTSFIKAAVYDAGGKCYAQSSEAVADERPAPGIFLQHGEDLFGSVMRCIAKSVKDLGEDASRVASMAFTGQMAGSMGIDDQWGDVTTWSCSLDSRYLPYSQSQIDKCSDEFYKISGTGSPVMCGKYEWFKTDFPEEAARIAKYVMLNGYVIGKLSGEDVSKAAIDYSLIAWTGMADIQNGTWSEEICQKLGIDMSILPKIAKGTDIGGYLSEEKAAELGLKPGIPLILGAGDKVAGCIGSGVSRDGDKIFETSSYAALSVQVDAFRPDIEKREFDVIGNITHDKYFVHKYFQGSGITLDWFVDEFVRKEGEKKSEAFRRIEELAAKVPEGSEKMLSIGFLGGSAMPFQPNQKGLFFGHTWSHGKGHFYRSLLEGFSFELAFLMDRVDEIYPEYAGRSVKLIGGGAKSTIWPQILADVTGRTFHVLNREDVALWGAAILGAAGIGDIKDIHAEAEAAVSVTATYTPDPEKHAIYQPYYKEYRKLRTELMGYYDSLSKL